MCLRRSPGKINLHAEGNEEDSEQETTVASTSTSLLPQATNSDNSLVELWRAPVWPVRDGSPEGAAGASPEAEVSVLAASSGSLPAKPQTAPALIHGSQERELPAPVTGPAPDTSFVPIPALTSGATSASPPIRSIDPNPASDSTPSPGFSPIHGQPPAPSPPSTSSPSPAPGSAPATGLLPTPGPVSTPGSLPAHGHVTAPGSPISTGPHPGPDTTPVPGSLPDTGSGRISGSDSEPSTHFCSHLCPGPCPHICPHPCPPSVPVLGTIVTRSSASASASASPSASPSASGFGREPQRGCPLLGTNPSALPSARPPSTSSEDELRGEDIEQDGAAQENS